MIRVRRPSGQWAQHMSPCSPGAGNAWERVPTVDIELREKSSLAHCCTKVLYRKRKSLSIKKSYGYLEVSGTINPTSKMNFQYLILPQSGRSCQNCSQINKSIKGITINQTQRYTTNIPITVATLM